MTIPSEIKMKRLSPMRGKKAASTAITTTSTTTVVNKNLQAQV